MYPPSSDDRDQLPSKNREDIPWTRINPTISPLVNRLLSMATNILLTLVCAQGYSGA